MKGLYKDNLTKIPDGWFTFYYANQQVERIGKNVNGKKEGTWFEFHPNGMMSESTVYHNDNQTGISMSWYSNGFPEDSITILDNSEISIHVNWFDNGNLAAAGRMLKNKSHGVWQYFYKSGKLAAKEEYDNGKLLNGTYYDENNNELTDTADRIKKKAAFPGGEKTWQKYMLKNAFFPRDYVITNSDHVTIVVSAMIDEEANVTEPIVEIPFKEPFNEMALSILKKSPKWIPAMSHNRPVKQGIRQPITFARR